jgi:segregation and condensation protein A
MSDETVIAFDAANVDAADVLRIEIDAFEGPLHALLDLARTHKIDLAQVSVGAIADQYLAFMAEARARNIELAGDYLVMAAWLTLLKSRLLIPKSEPPADAPDPQSLETALRAKLMRLAQTREAAARLEALPQVGRDVFLNGAPEATALSVNKTWRADLYDLLRAYCGARAKTTRKRSYRTVARRAYPIETARRSLEAALPTLTEWRTLRALAPAPRDSAEDAPPPESYVASTFGASLELAREQKLELRQEAAFDPLYIRARRTERR